MVALFPVASEGPDDTEDLQIYELFVPEKRTNKGRDEVSTNSVRT